MVNQLLKEQTLVLIKPDGVERGLVGEIIGRFEKVGLRLRALKLVRVTPDLAFQHYGQNENWFQKVGQKVLAFYQKHGFDPGEMLGTMEPAKIGHLVQKWNVDYLTAGPVVAMVWEGPQAVSLVRKIVGPTYPDEAPPGTIRGDFSHESVLLANAQKRSVRNLIHASDSPESAKLEIELWFHQDEVI